MVKATAVAVRLRRPNPVMGRAKARTRRSKHHYGRAVTLTEAQYLKLLAFIKSGDYNPDARVRDEVLLRLSYNCGLRVCEMAGIKWRKSILDADGKVVDAIHITPGITKRVIERYVTLRPEVREALRRLRNERPHDIYVIHALQPSRGRSKRAKSLGRGQTHPNTLVQYWKRLYAAAGLAGATSHSGRRTFITILGQRCNLVGASLRDVQLLVGHASLETTQAYLDQVAAAQKKQLVARMY